MSTDIDLELEQLIGELSAIRIRANTVAAEFGPDTLVFVDYLSSMLLVELGRLRVGYEPQQDRRTG